jgi:hypothetical protein
MSAKPLARVATVRRVRVTVDLDATSYSLLLALTKHTGKPEAEVVGDALRCLFAHFPRPGDET